MACWGLPVLAPNVSCPGKPLCCGQTPDGWSPATDPLQEVVVRDLLVLVGKGEWMATLKLASKGNQKEDL